MRHRIILTVTAAALALSLAGCGDDDAGDTAATSSSSSSSSTTEAVDDAGGERWAPAPDAERPPIIDEAWPESTPYRLDYGEVLWVDDDGIGRLIGEGAHIDCEPLLGGHSDIEWHDRYADVPGFAGLVCNPPTLDG